MKKKQRALNQDTDLLVESSNTRLKETCERFCQNKTALVALIVLLIIVLSACFADVIAPYDYVKADYLNTFAMPSGEHLMGTDNLGRDIFSRVLKGGQVSLLVALCSIAIAIVIGGFFGATAAYFGGLYGSIIMRVMDVIMSIPGFLLAVAISASLGTGISNTIIAISVSSIPAFARIMNAAVLTVKGQEYIEAAVASGARHSRILMKYVIPNTLASLIVNSTLRIGSAVLQISGLSFIGLGVQPPQAEWGSMLSFGRQYIRDFYPIVVFPGLAILITMVAINLFGDGLRDALDPRMKK